MLKEYHSIKVLQTAEMSEFFSSTFQNVLFGLPKIHQF